MNALNRYSSHTHRVLSLVVLFVLLGLSAIGLSQCRLADKSVTGVDSSVNAFHGRSRSSSCIRNCRKKFSAAMKKESARHHEALEKCGRDRFCKQKERDFHQERVAELRSEKQKCIAGCRYNEGGGKAGS